MRSGLRLLPALSVRPSPGGPTPALPSRSGGPCRSLPALRPALDCRAVRTSRAALRRSPAVRFPALSRRSPGGNSESFRTARYAHNSAFRTVSALLDAGLMRSYANVADLLPSAGSTPKRGGLLRSETHHPQIPAYLTRGRGHLCRLTPDRYAYIWGVPPPGQTYAGIQAIAPFLGRTYACIWNMQVSECIFRGFYGVSGS